MRLGRPKVPTIEGKHVFKLGKADIIEEGKDITLIACGIMVRAALEASVILKKEGLSCRVIDMHTIKPLDTSVIIQAADQTHGIVVCEEHMVIGGLASAVDDVVLENAPCRVERIGIKNRFGQSGETEELLKEYNLTASDIVNQARKLLNKK